MMNIMRTTRCFGNAVESLVLHANSRASATPFLNSLLSSYYLSRCCHHRGFHFKKSVRLKCNFIKLVSSNNSLSPASGHLLRKTCRCLYTTSFPTSYSWPSISCNDLLNHATKTDSRCLTSAPTTDPLSPTSPQFRCYLETLLREFDEITNKLSAGISDDLQQQKVVKRRQELGPVVDKICEINEKRKELEEVSLLLEDDDTEMKRLAEVEEQKCRNSIEELEDELMSILKPTSPFDGNDVMVELTAGVGGQEAMLFTLDVFNMYQNYAKFRGWQCNVLSYATTDLGGVRHASISMQGPDAYKLMKYEGGVHRVQRIPKTEKSGRVHTSTMTVAVLPQPKEIDLRLDPKDLRIETKKASGAGGQHVNTTDSAVRILHIPTGISADSQQHRSQHKNRQIAMTMLHARIYRKQLDEQDSKERKIRNQQVGTSGRSEKIRTYNFNQDRVTDHRVSLNEFDVEGFLGGGELLDDLISELCYQDEMDILRNTIENVYRDHHTA